MMNKETCRVEKCSKVLEKWVENSRRHGCDEK